VTNARRADTNILVSALLVETSQPARLVELWRRGSFQLVTSAPQLEELARVTRYEKLRYRLVPALTGRLVNDLRDVAVLADRLPRIEASPDPFDNYLLATAIAGSADFLVTGDKLHLLSLRRYRGVKIITVVDFLTMLKN
jgi:putative PIN family toxin of toxin-antitoxin system